MKRKIMATLALCLTLACLFCMPVWASEAALTEQAEDTAPQPEQTVSARISVWLADHSAEIFSALALCGSLVLGWLYKKGFLPVLSGALSNMSDSLAKGVKAVGEATDTLSESTRQTLERLSGQMDAALEGVSMVSEYAGTLTQATDALQADLKASGEQRARMERVLVGQMQLFYDFFMAVNLPQHQKDRLGAAYNEMMAALKEGTRHDPSKETVA